MSKFVGVRGIENTKENITRQSNKFEESIKHQIKESIRVKKEIMNNYLEVIEAITEKIILAYNFNKKVIWFGNGGSAADAQHLSCELVSKFYKDRGALASIALTTNTSLLTAISNDDDFDEIFVRQIEALAEKGDILIGITTSGISQNVINALKYGKKIGTINIAFTGEFTEKINSYIDYIVNVPSNDTARIQESHIMIGHIICQIVEEELFGEDK
jgi:D-sedoheptulose 7-phosphate isomerase